MTDKESDSEEKKQSKDEIKLSQKEAEELLEKLRESDEPYPKREIKPPKSSIIISKAPKFDIGNSDDVDIDSIVSELQSEGVDPSEVLTFSVPETVHLSTWQRRSVIVALSLGMYNFLISAVAAFYGELQLAGGFSAVAGLAWISSGLIRYWPSQRD